MFENRAKITLDDLFFVDGNGPMGARFTDFGKIVVPLEEAEML